MNKKAPCFASTADLAVIAGLVLAILWFCQDLTFRGEVPFFRDLGTYFYPLRLSVAESFKAGELPLWDRRLAQGFPLLAAFQPGVFYPPHFLLAVAPFFLAIRLLFVVHFIIAAIGAYKLIRSWHYPFFLAVIGALLFSLGGTMVSLSNLLNHFQSAVWLPWVLLTWERLLCAPTWRKFLIFTFTSTLQFLAGSPEVFAMGMVLVVFDGLRMRSQEKQPSLTCIFGLLAGATLLLLAISSLQIFPTGELFLQSRRQQPIPTGEAVSWSLNPLNLLNLFFLDRETELGSTTGMRYFLANRSPFFITYYMGNMSLFGIFLFLYYGSWREKLITGGLILVFLTLAFGSWTPVYPYLLRHIPWLSAFRYPEKFFFLTYATLIFITVRGLGLTFEHHNNRTKRTVIVLGCACLVSIGVYAAALFNADYLTNITGNRTSLFPSSAENANAVVSLLTNLERQVLLSVAIALLLYLAERKKIKSPLVKILLVAVVFVDLVSAHKGFLFAVHPQEIAMSPGDSVRQATRGIRIFYYPSQNNLHPAFISGSGSPTYRKFVALWFRNLLPNAGIFYGAELMQEIDALSRRPYTAFLSFANGIEPQAQIRLLRAFNVGYVIAFRELSIPGLALLSHYPQNFSWLYKVERPMPRAYIVNHSAVEIEVMRTLQRLSDGGFDPSADVLLDREIRIRPKRSLDAKATILRYKNTLVVIKTETNDNGILVLLDSYYPGWKAYVDGRESAIARANHFYRAVAIPQGRHLVEFKYEPASFKIGLIISSITLFSIVVVSLILFVKKRKSLPSGPSLHSSGEFFSQNL
jgi:hypothetical protein